MLWITQGKVQDLSLFHTFCMSFSMPFDSIKKYYKMCHMCHKLISFYSVMFLDLFLYASFFVYVIVSPLFSLCIYSFSLMLLSLFCACFSPTLCLSKWLLFPLAYFLLRSWLLFHAFFFVSMTLYLCFFVCMSMLMFFMLLSFPLWLCFCHGL